MSLDWSPDGKYVAVQTDKREVRVFDAQASKEIIVLPIAGQYGASEKCNIAFSPDGKWLVAGTVDISVWEVGTWSLRGKIAGPHVSIKPPAYARLRLAVAPDSRHIIVASDSNQKGRPTVEKFTLYDLITLNAVWEKYPDVSERQWIRTPIVFTPDGKRIVFAVFKLCLFPDPLPHPRPGEKQSNIIVLDALTGNVIKTLEKVHSDLPETLALSKDGRYVATATMTGVTESYIGTNRDPIRIWGIDTGSLMAELPIEGYPQSLAFSQDGRYLVSGHSETPNMIFMVWEWRTSRTIQTLKIRDWGAAPFSMAFSPDNKSLASATGHQLILFDFKN
jgi:WD40 repeat protein